MIDLGQQEYSPLTRWSIAFMALHAAAEGCFLPFLTIYLRQLGLTSPYIGVILSMKVAIGTISGPVWRHLSRKFGKQKSLVLASICAGIVLRVGLSLIMPVSPEYLIEYCADMPDSLTTPPHPIAAVTNIIPTLTNSQGDFGIKENNQSQQYPISITGIITGFEQTMARVDDDTHGKGFISSLFITVMIVIFVGELFAASGFQLVRVSLYHHLDNTDNFNLFPIVMSVWSICGGLSAVVISGAVDQAPCIILGTRSSMVIQFVCSTVFLLMTLAVSIFLPLFEPHSLLHSTGRATKALNFLFSDIHHIILVANSMVLGILTSACTGFLFWHLQDLGGTEFSMGFFLFVESTSQCVIRMRSVSLLRKLGEVGVFGLNFGCLAVTYLYFAVIQNSWLTSPIGLTSGLVLTLFWKAVSDSIEQTAPPGLYLHMFKHLEVLYACGSVLGYVSVGFLGGVIRFKFVFVIFGVLALIWGGVSCLTMHFFPQKETVHYAKLFEAKGDSEGSGEDWLEKAMDDEEEL